MNDINPKTGRPNYWANPSQPCPHQNLAFTDAETWCETCGADLDPTDTSKEK